MTRRAAPRAAQIFEFTVGDDDVAMVLATDGLWDQLSPAEVAEYLRGRELKGALDAMTAEAARRWRAREGSSDDITIVAVRFGPPTPVAGEVSPA